MSGAPGRATAVALLGLTGRLVDIEAALTNQKPGLKLVGLPDAALREAQARVRSAIEHSGFEMPTRHLTVNLSPAALPKHGSAFDLGIAVAVLVTQGVIDAAAIDGVVHVGELGLDGRLRPVPGRAAVRARRPRERASHRRRPDRQRGGGVPRLGRPDPRRAQPAGARDRARGRARAGAGGAGARSVDRGRRAAGARSRRRGRQRRGDRGPARRRGRGASRADGRAAGSGQDHARHASRRPAARPRRGGGARRDLHRVARGRGGRRAASAAGRPGRRRTTPPPRRRSSAAAAPGSGPGQRRGRPAASSSSTRRPSSPPPRSTRCASRSSPAGSRSSARPRRPGSPAGSSSCSPPTRAPAGSSAPRTASASARPSPGAAIWTASRARCSTGSTSSCGSIASRPPSCGFGTIGPGSPPRRRGPASRRRGPDPPPGSRERPGR